MPNSTFTQAALANDPTFRTRVTQSMSTIAWQVQNEADNTPNHTNRLGYARQVLRQLDHETDVILPNFVMRPNVLGFETSYEFDYATQKGRVVTASGDPDILSQIATDWDAMAAAAGFIAASPPGPP